MGWAMSEMPLTNRLVIMLAADVVLFVAQFGAILAGVLQQGAIALCLVLLGMLASLVALWASLSAKGFLWLRLLNAVALITYGLAIAYFVSRMD